MRALKRLIIFLLVLGLIAFTAAWFFAASQVKSRLTEFSNQSRGTDRSLQFNSVDVKGFPLKFDVQLTNLIAEDANQGLSWKAPETIGISLKVFDPFTVNAHLSGKHEIRPFGSDSSQIPIDLDLKASKLAIRGGLDKEIKAIDIKVEKATVSNDFLGATEIQNLNFKLDPPTDFGARFKATVDQVSLPQPLSEIGNFTKGETSGVFLPRLPKTFKKRHMQAWQGAGGDLIIEEFIGNLDSLKIDGSGNISLDKDLQPNLDLTTYANGFDSLITRATELSYIQKEQQNAVQLGSMIFNRPARSGTGKELVLPLKIESGWVTFGPFKVLELPKISWPK